MRVEEHIKLMPRTLANMMDNLAGIEDLELAKYFLMEAQSQINNYLEGKKKSEEGKDE